MSEIGKGVSDGVARLYFHGCMMIAANPEITAQGYGPAARQMAEDFRRAADLIEGSAIFAEHVLAQMRGKGS